MTRTFALSASILLVSACAHTSSGPTPPDANVTDGGGDAGEGDAGHDAEDAGAARDADAAKDRDGAALDDAAIDQDGGRADAGADASASCAEEDAQPVGCRYVSSDGTATITTIEPALVTSARCDNDPVRVSFRFVADDPASHRCARDRDAGIAEWTFVVGDGKAPPRSCIEGAAIHEGTALRVRRRDIVEGACSPVLFVFDAKLSERCSAECFR